MNRGRRILLISPVFHGYWRSIAAGFEANGHTVAVHCYDEHVGPVAKAKNKIVYEGLDRVRPGVGTERFVQAATRSARTALREHHPDAVVIVKGDLLGDGFWDDMTRAGLPHVLWLYDELRRTLHPPDRLGEVGAIASYSPADVASLEDRGIAATHVPLAFDPTFAHLRIPSDDVVFIGARYPGRVAVLDALRQHGIPVRAVGNDWSHRAVDRIRTWDWHRPDIPARPSVPRGLGAAMMAGAAGTLNVHGDQDGFTMRTFEASGVGALQFIDRADVAVHYEPGVEILPFESAEEIVAHRERSRADPLWGRRIRDAARRRTLAEHTFAHRAARLETLWD